MAEVQRAGNIVRERCTVDKMNAEIERRIDLLLARHGGHIEV